MHPDRLPEIDQDRVACQQVLEEDHSVFSIQWLVIPPGFHCELSSEGLLQLYHEYIEHCTLGIIRSVERDSGVEFRLLGSSVAILRFSPALTVKTASGEKTTLRISGGFLVQPKQCDKGQFEFFVETVASGTRLTLKLSDYCPLLLGSSQPSIWRKWLYRLTQAYLHKIVTLHFLAIVYRKVTGEKLKSGTIRIAVRKGAET